MAEICSVLVDKVKPNDVHVHPVARGESVSWHIGIGDDFAIFVPGGSLAEIQAIGERIVELAKASAVQQSPRDPFLPEPMDAYDVDAIPQL